MAQKYVTTKSFFEARRRRAYISSWLPLKSTGDELRIKIEFKMPLLGESLQGMPEMVSEAYVVMAKDKSALQKTALAMLCEGMQMVFFSTDQILEAAATGNGVKLGKFVVVATGEDEDRQVDLTFTAHMPIPEPLREYFWRHLHADVFIETVYSQSEMLLNDNTDEFEDEEEETPEPEAEEEQSQGTLVTVN